ncbi:MAG: flap endonuclease, partial [Acidimicrobiia bacterium]
MQLHLIDGTYELYRAFYGAPPRSDPTGREVGGTYAITSSTLGLLSEPGVTHVAAAFDTIIESFRNDLYPGYKTGEGIDPLLRAQFPLAEEAMRAIGITV